jgi:cytochrome c-type biogenesis protein CcmH/NrfF
MSPFCPGRTLADCPSDKATAWRQDIRRMLAEGKSAAEIRRELNQRSGVNLTGTPESSIGWMLPVGFLVGAGGILALVLVRFRKDEDTEPATPDDDDDDGEGDRKNPPDDDDELEARLKRELEDED